jgi:hypothetical protein
MLDDLEYTMSNLFAQLGLDNSQDAIDEFVKNAQLADDETLAEAKLWNDSQRAFLQEEWNRDGVWVEIIDELNLLLHPKP